MKKIIAVAVVAFAIQMSFGAMTAVDSAEDVATKTSCETRYENNVELMCK